MLVLTIQLIELILIILVAVIFNRIAKEREILSNQVDKLQKELNTYSSYKELSTSCIIKTLAKIKSNFAVSKRDKIVLIQWLIANFNNDLYSLNKINTRKTYTYKKACDIILNYIRTNNNKIEALNATFYLINPKK